MHARTLALVLTLAACAPVESLGDDPSDSVAQHGLYDFSLSYSGPRLSDPYGACWATQHSLNCGTPYGAARVTTTTQVPLPTGGTATPLELVSRSCGYDSDCRVVEHWLDACGTRYSVGIYSSAQELSDFNLLQSYCATGYPACTSGLSQSYYNNTADDGRVVPWGAQAVARCCAGRCMTFAP
jgi:hypothetical protein